MVPLLFVLRGLRNKEYNAKKRKRVKRNEIQCMIIFIENLLLLLVLAQQATGTNLEFKVFFIYWATVFVRYICTYMTVFANTVYFHISKLLLLIGFLRLVICS